MAGSFTVLTKEQSPQAAVPAHPALLKALPRAYAEQCVAGLLPKTQPATGYYFGVGVGQREIFPPGVNRKLSQS